MWWTLTVSQSSKRENSSSIIPKVIVASWLERKATQRRIEARIFRSCSQPSNFVSTYLRAPKKEVFLPVRVDYWQVVLGISYYSARQYHLSEPGLPLQVLTDSCGEQNLLDENRFQQLGIPTMLQASDHPTFTLSSNTHTESVHLVIYGSGSELLKFVVFTAPISLWIWGIPWL